MKIDFNNVRLQALHEYNDLVLKLNKATTCSNGEKIVEISARHIQKDLQQLRQDLIAIASSYQEGDEDCKCVLEDDMTILEFNPEV